MKISKNCSVCFAKVICSNNNDFGNKYCNDFHKALESKLHSHNTTNGKIQTDNIVKKILLIQSKLVGYTHIEEIKQAFDDIEIVVSELHH